MIETSLNNLPLYYSAQHLESIVFMLKEHYPHTDNVLCVNIDVVDDVDVVKLKKNIPIGCKLVYVNLEHKHPVDEYGNIPFCHPNYTRMFNDSISCFDEIWDFQIENYEYFKIHGLGGKYRFKPLRYTTWFDKYKTTEEPQYDIQLECVVDTNIRVDALRVLTQEPATIINEEIVRSYDKIRLNLTNTFDSDVKFKAKNLCRYGFDCPHYDYACTINNMRIFEYVCMNKPVIVWDYYEISSHEYFKDLCIYINHLESAYELGKILAKPSRNDVADIFKRISYGDSDYDVYRLNIIRDHCNKTGAKIPDSVL